MNIFLRLAAKLAFGALVLTQTPVHAAGSDYPLDRFPTTKLTEQAALQEGAKLFVNYCLGCHSAQYMRYNRLREIGLTDDQIKRNLLFSADKVGEGMKIAMRVDDAKSWFGGQPPDLSVIARARASHSGTGSDWLYTYLRAYYRDSTRPSGWNNALFPNVGMPNVFWELQGSRGVVIEDVHAAKDAASKGSFVKTSVRFDESGLRSESKDTIPGPAKEGMQFLLGKSQGGQLSAAQFDDAMANLTAYITYMSDPSANERKRLGVWVMLYLCGFFVLAWWLNKTYWKDIK